MPIHTLSLNRPPNSIFPISSSSSAAAAICSLKTKMSQRRRFAVLRTGHATPYTEKTHGDYGNMLKGTLKDEDEHWDIYSVIDGDFSFETQIQSYDGFVITGSACDAHADVDWIIRLADDIRSLHESKKKMLGICFGHQILARALGGKTGRAAVGWELGVKSLNVDTKMVKQLYGLELSSPLNGIESHRDQVSCAPPGGIVLASSAKTEIEMFSVGDHVLGIQCHPEFTKDVVLDIIHGRLSANVISTEVANEAVESFDQSHVDQEPLKTLCKTFLKTNVKVVSGP